MLDVMAAAYVRYSLREDGCTAYRRQYGFLESESFLFRISTACACRVAEYIRPILGFGPQPCIIVTSPIPKADKCRTHPVLLRVLQPATSRREIMALNPRGQVPTFNDNGIIVNESLAILLYLEEAYPSPTLMPGTPGQRAQVCALPCTLSCQHA